MAVDRELLLHYIDKLHGSLLETGRTMNRVILWMAILSLFALAIAIGVVESDGILAMSGVNFRLPISVLLLGSSGLLAILFVYFLALSKYEERIKTAIISMYDDLDFTQIREDEDVIHPLEFPNMILLLFISDRLRRPPSRTRDVIAVTVVFMVISALPIAAEIASFLRVIQVHGVTWWSIAWYICIAALTAFYLWHYVSELRS